MKFFNLITLIITFFNTNALQINTDLQVGKVDGSHSVNLTGAFTYNVPIKIPKGTKGIQPSLSLNYNSQSGYGIAGYGWNLGGQSVITRVNKTKYYDDQIKSVELTDDDAFALDGKRLIKIKTTNNQLEFRTEIETYQQVVYDRTKKQFTIKTKDGKTIEYGNTLDAKLMTEDGFTTLIWFINKVTDRNGSYMTYHYVEEDRQVLLDKIKYTGNAISSLTPFTEVSLKYINLPNQNISYVKGNKIKQHKILSEIKSTINNQHYKSYRIIHTTDLSHKKIAKIYESAEDLNLDEDDSNYNLNTINPLEFEYEFSTLDQNGANETELLLHGTENNHIYYPADFNNDGLTDFLVFAFERKLPNQLNSVYTNNYTDMYLYLKNTKNCNNPPFYTEYDLGNINLKQNITIDDLTFGTEKKIIDVLRNFYIEDIKILRGEVNGDGLLDIVIGVKESRSNISTYFSMLSNGIGNFVLSSHTVEADDNNGVVYFSDYDRHVSSLIDVDGDGIKELFIFNYDNHKAKIRSLDVSDNTDQRINYDQFIGDLPEDADISVVKDTEQISVTDYNGDGINEVIVTYRYLNENKIFLTFNFDENEKISFLKNPFTSEDLLSINFANPDISKSPRLHERFVDINGDNKKDIVLVGEDGIFSIQVAEDKSFEDSGYIKYTTNAQAYNGWYGENKTYYTVDINRDGLTDIISLESKYTAEEGIRTYFHIYINRGINESNNTIEFHHNVVSTLYYDTTTNYPIDFIDINGDGYYEILLQNPYKSDFASQLKPPIILTTVFDPSFNNNLKEIKDSYSNTTNIKYSSTNLLKCSENDLTLNYPYRVINPSITAVENVSIKSGTSTISNIDYSYSNLIVRLDGMGALGFNETVQTDHINNVITHNFFELYQAKATLLPFISYTGYLDDSIDAENPVFKLINHTKKINAVNNVGNTKIRKVLPQKTLVHDFLNGSINDTNFTSYDSFGNVENIITSVSEFNSLDNSNYTFNESTGVLNVVGSKVDEIESSTIDLTYNDCDWWATYLPKSSKTTVTRKDQVPYEANIKYVYNSANGNLSKETRDQGTTNQLQTSYFNYNDFGLPEGISILPYNSTIRRQDFFEYDELGRFLIKTKNADEITTESIILDPVHSRPTTITDVQENITEYDYDTFFKEKSETDYLGNTTNIIRSWVLEDDDIFNLDVSLKPAFKITIDGPSMSETTTYYDALERLVATKTEQYSNGNSTNIYTYTYITYNNKGLPFSTALPFFDGENPISKTYLYDRHNRIKTIYETQKSPVFYSYGLRTTSNTGAQIISKQAEFDATGNVIKTQNGLNGYSTYEYGSHGELIGVTDKNSNVLIKSEYDKFGRQTALIDKNAGTSKYLYNSFNELTQQTDANENITNYKYDSFGRIEQTTITSKDDETITYDYTYIEPNLEANTQPNGVYQLESIERSDNNYSTEYDYDSYGRLTSKTDIIDEQTLETRTSYNNLGLISSITYPSSAKENLIYDENGTGILKSATISYGINSKQVYLLNEVNNLGQVIDYNLDKINNTKTFNDFGMISEQKAVKDAAILFDWSYIININNSNLNSRTDNLNENIENFTYDNLHRLTHINYEYAAGYSFNGNINYKIDAGTYTYDETKTNAVTSITNTPDNIPLMRQAISYTSFDRANSINENNYDYQIYYGPNNDRKKTLLTNLNDEIYTKYYSNNFEKLKLPDNITYELHYLSYANSTDAIFLVEKNSDIDDTGRSIQTINDYLYFAFTDHLGSILKIVDGNGVALEEQSFDAWGRKRSPANWQPYVTLEEKTTQNLVWFNRGYTGHEHLYEFGLINMNNRLYDPIVGRMLSVDNFVGDPTSLQTFNRYSYVLNNPLKYIDPTGESIDGSPNCLPIAVITPTSSTSSNLFGIGLAYNNNHISFTNFSDYSLGNSYQHWTSFADNYTTNYSWSEYQDIYGLEDWNQADYYDFYRDTYGNSYERWADAESLKYASTDGLGEYAMGLSDITGSALHIGLSVVPLSFLNKLKVGVGINRAITYAKKGVNVATKNIKLLSQGMVPNAGGKIISFMTKENSIFYRVYSSNPNGGAFLTKIPPKSSAFAREGLALPNSNTAKFIQKVTVPKGVILQRSRTLSAFGKRGGLEQFQILNFEPGIIFHPGILLK